VGANRHRRHSEDVLPPLGDVLAGLVGELDPEPGALRNVEVTLGDDRAVLPGALDQ
jgi:hypothetical protein